jgi:MGT family glycosyltransferase
VNAEAFPDHYQFIGPALEGRAPTAPFDLDLYSNGRKTVYVSTGSLLKDVQRKFFQKVVSAFADKNVTVLLSCPENLLKTWPDNFYPQLFWPQLEVLKHVDVVVTAGGFNTINESLYFDKPMIVIPLANDQFGNANLIEQHGVGIKLRYRRLTVEQLSVSLDEVLSDMSFYNSARELGRTLRAGGGSQAAASVIEKALTQCAK